MILVSILMQVLLGILLTALVYYVFLRVTNRAQLIKDPAIGYDNKTSTLVIDGRADGGTLASLTFDTVNPSSTNFVKLAKSLNLKGGAQFSYSMWMMIRDSSLNLDGRVILLRGDAKTYRVKKTNLSTNMTSLEPFHVKCPLIRFGTRDGDGVMSFGVEFNAVNEPDTRISIKPNNQVQDTTLHRNLWSLLNKNWMLVSFVFSDHVAIDDFEDGIEVSVYINDVKYASERKRDMFVQNNGHLHLFTDTDVAATGNQGAANGVAIANLTYHNFALNPIDLRGILGKGVPQHGYKGRDFKAQPLYLSEYNKLDTYNA